MRRLFDILLVMTALTALAGCDQINDLLGGDDDDDQASDGADAGTQVEPVQPQPAQPQAGQPQPGQPQPDQPPAGQPPSTTGDGGPASVCERAARCCDAASNVQNFPQIYAVQREQTCRTLHMNTNLNDDGCRTAMGVVRQLFRMINQAPPADCLEQQ
jgi:hypothetical protein